KKHGGRQSAIDAGAVYEYLETNPGQTPRELGLIFWGVAKDTGAVCSKLESHGYLVWLDERNRIHPYRRIG
ncbi:MAG: hypothetical protein KKD01_20010, partial [Proteobacteria bacterium]|nr:hypothetical protein [Pseudomonadota bacterium]